MGIEGWVFILKLGQFPNTPEILVLFAELDSIVFPQWDYGYRSSKESRGEFSIALGI
jgi:hypothetical protein